MEHPLYTDDVVARKSNLSMLATVERTHADVETHEPYPGRDEIEKINKDNDIRKSAFNQFMRDGIPPKGTVMVRWQITTVAQLIPENKLEPVARALLIGDVVKKGVRDAMSGVVINTLTMCTLQPVGEFTLNNTRNRGNASLMGIPLLDSLDSSVRRINPEQSAPIDNVPASELKYDADLIKEVLVVYRGWLGRIEEIHKFLVLRLHDNCVVEIEDDAAEQLDGSLDEFSVGDLVQTKKGILRNGRWIYGNYNPNTLPFGTVVDERVTSVVVDWLERRIDGARSDTGEPPTELERDEFESPDFWVYDRTRRPSSAETNVENSTVSYSELDVCLGLRVRFRDLSGACVKYDGSSGRGQVRRIGRKDTSGYDLNVFEIARFHGNVVIQWQDLSISTERSTDVVPDIVIDNDHDAWPGEIAHPLELVDVPDVAGVQAASKVGVVQSVNDVERMAKIRWCPQASLQYSVDTEDSGHRAAVSRVVGQASGDAEEVSLYDVEAPGELNVRRGDIVIITNRRWQTNGQTPQEREWLGEIVDTCLDGTLTVRLGAIDEVQDVNLFREDVVVAIRSDGSDEYGGGEDVGSDMAEMSIDSEGEVRFTDGAEDYPLNDDDDDDSLDEDVAARYEDENGEAMDADDVEDEEWESDIADGSSTNDDVVMAEAPDTAERPPTGETGEHMPSIGDMSESSTDAPPSYLVLPTEVPSSHHFYSKESSPSQPHIKRIIKEHKILRYDADLPSEIYVRTWDTRLDLLRVLFVGPAETPYASAPFVIDFYLSGNFPSEPPQAFFHSWTTQGRVNPNLYEDGKICLSLLGTWEGSGRSETWSASGSTLLQVLVSILGLVLVREPYFNEAGYEHLVGLESSRRSSELYNEATYLKSKGFLAAALTGKERGVQGVEDVLEWLYTDEKGPKLLQKSIEDVDQVLRRSEGVGNGEEGPVMSKGACIPLRRVLERLKEL